MPSSSPTMQPLHSITSRTITSGRHSCAIASTSGTIARVVMSAKTVTTNSGKAGSDGAGMGGKGVQVERSEVSQSRPASK